MFESNYEQNNLPNELFLDPSIFCSSEFLNSLMEAQSEDRQIRYIIPNFIKDIHKSFKNSEFDAIISDENVSQLFEDFFTLITREIKNRIMYVREFRIIEPKIGINEDLMEGKYSQNREKYIKWLDNKTEVLEQSFKELKRLKKPKNDYYSEEYVYPMKYDLKTLFDLLLDIDLYLKIAQQEKKQDKVRFFSYIIWKNRHILLEYKKKFLDRLQWFNEQEWDLFRNRMSIFESFAAKIDDLAHKNSIKLLNYFLDNPNLDKINANTLLVIENIRRLNLENFILREFSTPQNISQKPKKVKQSAISLKSTAKYVDKNDSVAIRELDLDQSSNYYHQFSKNEPFYSFITTSIGYQATLSTIKRLSLQKVSKAIIDFISNTIQKCFKFPILDIFATSACLIVHIKDKIVMRKKIMVAIDMLEKLNNTKFLYNNDPWQGKILLYLGYLCAKYGEKTGKDVFFRLIEQIIACYNIPLIVGGKSASSKNESHLKHMLKQSQCSKHVQTEIQSYFQKIPIAEFRRFLAEKSFYYSSVPFLKKWYGHGLVTNWYPEK